MKNKSIRFVSSDSFAESAIDPPIPASKTLPDWWLKMPSSTDQSCPMREKRNETIKSCMPVLDALSAGYTQRLWTDIYIKDDGKSYRYAIAPEPMIMRQYSHDHRFPVPEDYYNIECAWQMPYIPQTPPGSSCLITHPVNRIDLPFFTMSGIIDTDADLFVRWGQLPFYIRKGFTGLIPCGTPLYQIIPFERNKWKTEACAVDEDYRIKGEARINKFFVGGYKKLIRTKKVWE